MTRQEEQVLQLLGKHHVQAGLVIPSKTLWRCWGPRPDATDLRTGLEGFVVKEIVAFDAAMAEYASTEQGAMRLIERQQLL